MQHLLARAVWDEDGVRDDVRALPVEHLGDPAAVLVVDETGDLKKGSHTVGIARQYTGTAGKVDNAQVAVYLAYATTSGHGVIDRELYPPQGWLDDPARLQAAGVPDRVGFATKLELTRRMLERALGAGVPDGWVTEQVPPECWLRISAGHGAEGRRWYTWTRVALDSTGAPPGRQRWLLVRRRLRTGSRRTTCAPARPACRWLPWSGWRGLAGRWRRHSRPARGCAAWISTRCAAGAAGTGG